MFLAETCPLAGQQADALREFMREPGNVQMVHGDVEGAHDKMARLVAHPPHVLVATAGQWGRHGLGADSPQWVPLPRARLEIQIRIATCHMRL